MAQVRQTPAEALRAAVARAQDVAAANSAAAAQLREEQSGAPVEAAPIAPVRTP